MILWRDRPHNKINFGDELSALLLPALGIPVSVVDNPAYAQVVAIGGNLERLQPFQKSLILGTGFLRDGPPVPSVQWDIRLIRGAPSAQRLGWKGPLGDPAILAPSLLKTKPKKRWALGIIPHVHGDEKYRQQVPKGAQYIDLTNEPLKVLKQIAACEAIASSSVHGWLIAVALGVPAKRFELTPGPGGEYRWDDVCSGLELKTPRPDDDFFTADLSKHQARIEKLIRNVAASAF